MYPVLPVKDTAKGPSVMDVIVSAAESWYEMCEYVTRNMPSLESVRRRPTERSPAVEPYSNLATTLAVTMYSPLFVGVKILLLLQDIAPFETILELHTRSVHAVELRDKSAES